MDWSSDYSYVKYKNDFYFQHKGIQMGNNSSVSVSNISVGIDLQTMFKDRPEIIFNGRFIDDFFLIIEDTEIIFFDSYLSNLFVHEDFTFSFEYSNISINFLDVQVSLNNLNELSTSLYRKPMSKHQMLHFNSNHAKHLIKSLPFSQGLRIIRLCSNELDRKTQLDILMEKFRIRMYPTKLLNDCMQKLLLIDRNSLIKPKSNLLISNLRIHNPHLLSKYNVQLSQVPNCNPSNKMFLVMTFYKNVFNFSKIIIESITDELKYCNDVKLRELAMQFNLCVSYKKTRSLKQFVS